MAAAGSRRAQGSRGQSLVEFAILVPILATILMIAVDVGRIYLGWVSLTNVARIGANFASMNPDAWQGGGDTTVQARYRSLMQKDATNIDCVMPSVLPAPTFGDTPQYALGSRVQVNLTCSFALVTPFLSALVGDGAGHISVSSNAVFTIRTGSVDGVTIGSTAATATPTAFPTVFQTTLPTPTPTETATATATQTATPTATGSSSGPTPTPTATAAATATPAPTPTLQPIVVSWYGQPTSADASGGGPPGTVNENQIVGIPPLTVTFYNTSTGGSPTGCLWSFGDSTSSNSCGNQVTKSYTTRGTYTVSLTIDGQIVSRASYVLVGCKVPAFAGVHVSNVQTNWTNAGFSASNLSYLDGHGNGNYKIGYQSLAGGLVNPSGGCSGATVTVGP